MPDHVHVRHRGEPKAVLHGQRYLTGQRLQADRTGSRPRPGQLVWCTAAAGWSKSARNAFIAPWLRGAAALLHDARFDPHERLELIDARAGRRAVHGADRVPRDRQARHAARRSRHSKASVAAGEALNPEVLHAWHEATGLWIRDGYGQTETGQLTGAPLGEQPRPGSMGKPLPGVDLDVDDGELVLATPRPTRRSSCATSATRRTRARGAPATASPRTRTATCTSRAAPTT